VKVSRDLWLQLEPLLTAALEMEASARAAWLEGIDATHPEIAPVLRRMLLSHERAERSRELETVPRLAPVPDWSSGHGPGARIGPFELVRPLGRGGMGEVWLARQADGRIARDVALKLPALHQQGEVWRERFRRERDILARLEHPHIARLYDAGVSESGQPWIAMEFIAGLSLSEHVASRPHSIPARLALFRQVLAAAAHAHRHLVVHRDLKPANILIDASGQVKLLDFGIAKLLVEDEATGGGDLTRLGGRVMTLRYAAPEQVSAGDITTATDIYSLGVILHEMLTGLAPYRAVREGRALTDAMLLQDEAAVPSRLAIPKPLARQLAGDLDCIILKALRRDPGERYGSVELFDEDILAHLQRRPVKARAGTWRYIAGRYAVRHKLPLAMAAAVLVTLLAGLVIADRERRVAVAEKARAERHFASVRKLANTFIFDVHDEIEPLPGSLKARQTLVSTALQYLDSLAAESRADPALALEVAGAYRKLAEIRGDTRAAHLGDPLNARRYAERAAKLLEALEAREPDNIQALREHRVVALLLGRLRLEGGDSGGVEETAKAAGIAEKITRLPGATIDDRRNLGATLAQWGGILAVVKDDHVAAATQLARAVEYLEALVRDKPGDLLSRADLAYAYERSAMAAEVTGKDEQLPLAFALLEKSIATTESVIRDDGARASRRQTLAKRFNNAARVKLRLGDVDGARDNAAKGLALIERLTAEDPRNVENASVLAGAFAMSSDIEYRAGRYERAIELARESIAVDARLPAETRAGLIVRENVVGAKRSLGTSSCAMSEKGSQPLSRRMALLKEGHALLVESRAFKRELVDRGIDAREAASAIREIDADLKRCSEAIARLSPA
jgi:tRNA A-37 threonylcarbamoyl transferase component Bud32/tetratricopeptide (TPR) repeat protein